MNREEIIRVFLRLDEQHPQESLDGLLALTSAATGTTPEAILGALWEDEACPSS